MTTTEGKNGESKGSGEKQNGSAHGNVDEKESTTISLSKRLNLLENLTKKVFDMMKNDMTREGGREERRGGGVSGIDLGYKN